MSDGMVGQLVAAPDLVQPVIGYRTFHVGLRGSEWMLVSPHQGEYWPHAEMGARCSDIPASPLLEGVRVLPHAAPNASCGCGIYAYYEPHRPCKPDWMTDPLGHQRPEVVALVALSGRIQAHETGMRAARCRICALANPLNVSGLREAAERIGVPVVGFDALPELAVEFGGPMPSSLLPALAEVVPAAAPATISDASPTPRTRQRRHWAMTMGNFGLCFANVATVVSGGPAWLSAVASMNALAAGVCLGARLASEADS